MLCCSCFFMSVPLSFIFNHWFIITRARARAHKYINCAHIILMFGNVLKHSVFKGKSRHSMGKFTCYCYTFLQFLVPLKSKPSRVLLSMEKSLQTLAFSSSRNKKNQEREPHSWSEPNPLAFQLLLQLEPYCTLKRGLWIISSEYHPCCTFWQYQCQ